MDLKEKSKEYYVYQLIDPRNGEVFYVGKGKGKRMKQHVPAAKRGNSDNPRKTLRIREIINDGFEVKYFVYAKDLLESDAFDIERELIKEIGREKLTNYHSGVNTVKEQAKLLLKRLKPIRKWAADKYANGGYTIEDLKRYKSLASFYRRMARHG